jgi:hypothetical protein
MRCFHEASIAEFGEARCQAETLQFMLLLVEDDNVEMLQEAGTLFRVSMTCPLNEVGMRFAQ